MNMFLSLLTTANPFLTMAEPVISLLDMVTGPAILLIGAVGTIYCIFLGLKLAKADEPQEHQKAKNALKNAIIGFALIFVLVVVLKVGIGPLSNWMSNNTVKVTVK